MNSRIQIIKENNVNIKHCFLFNLNADFDIKSFVNSFQQIQFPLNQIYCFSPDTKIQNEIKQYLLPVWKSLITDKNSSAILYNNAVPSSKSYNKKSYKKIKIQKFKTFLAKYKKMFYIKGNYYIFLDKTGISYEFLRGCEDEILNINMIELYTEQYPLYKNQVSQDAVFNYLSHHNFIMKHYQQIKIGQNKSIWIK